MVTNFECQTAGVGQLNAVLGGLGLCYMTTTMTNSSGTRRKLYHLLHIRLSKKRYVSQWTSEWKGGCVFVLDVEQFFFGRYSNAWLELLFHSSLRRRLVWLMIPPKLLLYYFHKYFHTLYKGWPVANCACTWLGLLEHNLAINKMNSSSHSNQHS